MTEQLDSREREIKRTVEYAPWSEDRLFQQLGTELLGDGKGFGGEDLDRARRFAQQWFEDRSARLRTEVCSAKSVQLFLQDGRGDLFTEAAVVIDALQAMRGHPAMSVVAAILIRRGLQAFCNGPTPAS